MKWIRAILAVVALMALFVAPPLMLVTFVGTPVPSEFELKAPLSDAAIIRLLSIVVWFLWAQTMWCAIAEIIAASRSSSLTRTRGTFALQQHFVRTLIGAVVAVSISLPALSSAHGSPGIAGSSPPGEHDTSAAKMQAPATQHVMPAARIGDTEVERSPTSTVEVRRGDSLWSIAEEHLGSGDRWIDIATLNEGRPMTGGQTFRTTSAIHPGWLLVIPDDSRSAEVAGREYVVEPGDTLSEIAQDHAGAADKWPDLFKRSQKVNQLIPLTDADRIYPGQRIVLPAQASTGTAEVQPSVDAGQRHSPRLKERRVTAPAQDLPGSPAPRSVDGPDADWLDNKSSEGGRSADEYENPDEPLPRWITPGLLGAGTLLAGSLLVSLRRRRATQYRSRRPGRTISVTPPDLVEVEKSVSVAGSTTVSLVEIVDESLKRLASTLRFNRAAMPELVAVEVTPAAVALHLRLAASAAPEPWVASDDGLAWVAQKSVLMDADTRDEFDGPSPWPLLVTIGHDHRDGAWLLNLEDQCISLDGDPVATADFARFIAAEVACNPWSKETSLELFGIAEEVAAIDPDRIAVHDEGSAVTSDAVAKAVRNIDRLADYGIDMSTARAFQDDPDPWPAQMLLLSSRPHTDELSRLRGLANAHRGRAGISIVELGAGAESGLQIHIDDLRRLTVPEANLTLTAVGLTSTEVHGCAALLAQANRTDDEAVPDLLGDGDWRKFATGTGALRAQYTSPRATSPIKPARSMLPAADDVYVDVAAIAPEELEILAPQVAESVHERVASADPDLDGDLSEWFSGAGPRPRLFLFGPVQARTKGVALEKRKAYYTELFAYLATRPFGATTEEVAEAFSISPARVRVDVNRLREWLGRNPRTGGKYIPDARDAPSAHARGMGVYEAIDVLVDVDLFRRLRLRAETSGRNGIADLRLALELVNGRPFQGLRPAGWGWLLEGDRLDQHLTCAIVDVAHVVVIDALQTGDFDAASRAATIATQAAPDDEIARLDLVAALQAAGHTQAADELLRNEVCNRADDGGAPSDLPARSQEILDKQGWPHKRVV
jgi:LysM repeat protein